jgi:hypothetical protein
MGPNRRAQERKRAAGEPECVTVDLSSFTAVRSPASG